jgi:hypothetical protein
VRLTDGDIGLGLPIQTATDGRSVAIFLTHCTGSAKLGVASLGAGSHQPDRSIRPYGRQSATVISLTHAVLTACMDSRQQLTLYLRTLPPD